MHIFQKDDLNFIENYFFIKYSKSLSTFKLVSIFIDSN